MTYFELTALSRKINYLLNMNDYFVDAEIQELMDTYKREMKIWKEKS